MSFCQFMILIAVVVAVTCSTVVSSIYICSAPFSWTISPKNTMSCCLPFNGTVGSINATYYSPSGDKFTVTMYEGAFCGEESETLCNNQHHNDQIHETCWNIANKTPSSMAITWQVSCDQTFGKCKVEVDQLGASDKSNCMQNKC